MPRTCTCPQATPRRLERADSHRRLDPLPGRQRSHSRQFRPTTEQARSVVPWRVPRQCIITMYSAPAPPLSFPVLPAGFDTSRLTSIVPPLDGSRSTRRSRPKEARGNGVRRHRCQFPGCPRNCKRRGPVPLSHWRSCLYGHGAGKAEQGRRPASQETCRPARHLPVAGVCQRGGEPHR